MVKVTSHWSLPSAENRTGPSSCWAAATPAPPRMVTAASAPLAAIDPAVNLRMSPPEAVSWRELFPHLSDCLHLDYDTPNRNGLTVCGSAPARPGRQAPTSGAHTRRQPLLQSPCRGTPVRDTELTVLVTVYDKIAPADLRASLDSISSQTVQPAHVVVVEDGPLTPALTAVLDATADLERFALPANRGAGRASQRGLAAVRTPWLARPAAAPTPGPTRCARRLAAARALDLRARAAA